MKEMCCGERNIDIDDDGFFLDGLDLNRDRWRFGFCCGFVCLLFFLDGLDLNRNRWRFGFCCGLVDKCFLFDSLHLNRDRWRLGFCCRIADRCFLLNGLDLNRDRWRFSFCCRLIDLLLFLLDRLEHIQTKIRLQHRLVWLLLLLMHQFVTIQKEYRKETTITIRTLICLFRKHEFISYSIHSPILFHTRFGDVLQTRWSLNRLYFTIYKKGIHQSACKLAVEYERELDIQYPFSPSSWTQSHQHCIVQTLLCTCTAQKMEMYTTNGWITFIIIYIHVYVPLILYMSCICRKLWIPYQSSYELSNPMNLLERLLQSQNCQRKIPSPIVWR